MNLTFVKYTKEVLKPVVREWETKFIKDIDDVKKCIEIKEVTEYTACYIADVNLMKHGIDEKSILSLLHRKNQEMNGNGIAEYLKIVTLSGIVRRLKDFKPYSKEETIVDESMVVHEYGVPIKQIKTIHKHEHNEVKIAYKNNGKYEFLELSPTVYGNATQEQISEWYKKNEKDKFYDFHGFYDLEKEVWRILYRLKAKGYVSERYVKGYVTGGGRRRYRGVKAKRYYSITNEGIEYLKGL